MSESQYTQKSGTQTTKPNKSRESIKKSINNDNCYNINKISPKKSEVKNESTIKEAKEFNTQFDGRSKYCYNCFNSIDYNCGEETYSEDFKNQVFCSKKCLKIQYLENSTFCKNDSCEKGHFV